MKKFKGFEKEDGSLVNEAWLNGYQFGDRLLEGVMFQVCINEYGRMSVSVGKSYAEYFSNFNEKKWLNEALKYAQENDIFQEHKDGGEDLVLIEDKA